MVESTIPAIRYANIDKKQLASMPSSRDQSAPPRTSVTLLCWGAYVVFDRTINSSVGGMETRSALIARQLLETFGWSVCFAVGDFNQDDPVEHEEIRFFRYQIFQRNIIEYARQRFSKRKWFPIINLNRDDWSLFWKLPVGHDSHNSPGLFLANLLDKTSF